MAETLGPAQVTARQSGARIAVSSADGGNIAPDAHPLRHVWWVAVAAVITAPLVTWFPMLAGRFPALGLPLYPPGLGVDLWQLQTFLLAGLCMLGVIVGRSDRWLGVACAVAGLTVFYRGAALDPTHAVIFGLGALMLVGVRLLPASRHQRVRVVLVGIAAFEAVYLIQQRLGYDLLWGPVFGGILQAEPQMYGTLGSVNATAGYLAVVAPLMPLWLALPVVVLVWMSHSLGAVAALVVGLAVKGMMTARARLAVLALLLAVALGGAWVVLHKETHFARVTIWQFALEDWRRTDPVLGYGLGGWGQRVPEMQRRANFSPTGELWQEAHNEPLQWVVEAGLVGALLLALWLRAHRHMFTDPVWGPSVVALAVQSLTWHPFHIVSSALLGLIVIGLASRPKETPVCAVA